MGAVIEHKECIIERVPAYKVICERHLDEGTFQAHEDVEMKTHSSKLAGANACVGMICNITLPYRYQYKILDNYNTPPLPVVYLVGSIMA
jgi:hypothetical protein